MLAFVGPFFPPAGDAEAGVAAFDDADVEAFALVEETRTGAHLSCFDDPRQKISCFKECREWMCCCEISVRGGLSRWLCLQEGCVKGGGKGELGHFMSAGKRRSLEQ